MAIPTPDPTTANAIDRVLEAERAVAVAVAAAQAAAQAAIEAARAGRRELLERARQRVMRVRERVQAGLALQLAGLDGEDAAPAPSAADADAANAAALARLAERLTTGDEG
jgi:cobalamin biosynthesis Mg chelatase CobN